MKRAISIAIVAAGALALGGLMAVTAQETGLLTIYDSEGNVKEQRQVEPGDYIGSCGYDPLIQKDPCAEQ